MWINKLTIRNCRSITQADLELSSKLNIIVGKNGSGKSSFLEALSILSTGRSFRTNRISEVTNHSASSIILNARLKSHDDILSNIGIEKKTGKTKIRINQQDIYAQSDLSHYLPLTVVHPESIKLITESSTGRRRYIDWLAFYLYPGFYTLWKKYNHVLKQRNFCLKNKDHRYALDNWTNELILLQPEIHSLRSAALAELVVYLSEINNEIFGIHSLDLKLKSGFPSNILLNLNSLDKFYRDKQDQDIHYGRTLFGVHRSDIHVSMNKLSAAQNASRGQLKLISLILFLAQSNLVQSKSENISLIAIDDIASELDIENYKILLNYLQTLKQQIFITSTTTKLLDQFSSRMFHVKHGELTLEC